ncbi:type IX secretion/gliding motility protein PorT/SprT [Prevotella falsenii]|uniref:type IX secretion/gliding motility protein PorT/SprT n=1 Tax=Prevotella falsenii TaxID=515414 RepID=UPI0004690F79|nr:porin family protein [Prevotella falsenii]
MKRLLYIILLLATSMVGFAQERTVQNRPYTDLRPFHFGVMVGTHLQDLEIVNTGPQMVDLDDGNGPVQKVISVDQDRWDAGFTVGVLGELRLNTTFQLRIAPTMYFGTRHLTFRNLTDLNTKGQPIERTQDLKTVYISCAFNLIAAAPRFNNHRPYLMLGINPMANLSGKSDDYLKLKGGDAYLEVGLGCDFYLPFFKLRPELKFMYGLSNSLDANHAKELRDKNMQMYANFAKEAHSKMIALTFYFE